MQIENTNPLARQTPSRSTAVELSVIMPCFNESELIEPFLRQWWEALEKQLISFEIIVINDGSTDGTGRILDRLRRELRGVRVIHQLNAGHDRAVRRGYELARGDYIFQVDPNGRYEVSDFFRFWELREQRVLVVAHRTHCLDSLFRRVLSHLLRFVSKLLFRTQLKDPNAPFRLLRRDLLQWYLSKIQPGSNAINLSLAVWIEKDFPNAVSQVAIPFRQRASGQRHCALLKFVGLWGTLLNDLIQLRFSMIALRISPPTELALASPQIAFWD